MSKKYLPKLKKLLQRLRSDRHEAGLTQVEAAKKLRRTQAYVSKIERGEWDVDAIELAEFAKVYKKSLDYFVK
jgi:transcriptional regulator with XRE-family HTH domain